MLVVIILMWQLLSALHCTRLSKKNVSGRGNISTLTESTISYDLYIQLVEEMCEKLILEIKLSKKKSAESQALCFCRGAQKDKLFFPNKIFLKERRGHPRAMVYNKT